MQILLMYLVYAFLHAIAFFGAVYFEKLHFIKTAFIFFIIMGVLIVMNKGILSALLGRTVDASPPFGNLHFANSGQTVDIQLGKQHNNPYLIYLIIVLTFIFWTASYFRLKEKQV